MLLGAYLRSRWDKKGQAMNAGKKKVIKASSIKTKKQFEELVKSGAEFAFDEPYGPEPESKESEPRRKKS